MPGAPAENLVLVRHGESMGNLADADARRRGAGRLDLDVRDADVPLSPAGEQQADAVGRYLAELDPDARPTLLLSSPFRRAYDTAGIALERAGVDAERVVDERLRERELGVFDGLTGVGIRELFPQEADLRRRVGKFYYRPPGGESWCDVALRVRSVLVSLRTELAAERVWAFSHQAVIMNFRLVLERLTERELLELDTTTPLANCSMTEYRWDAAPEGRGRAVLVRYNDTTAVDEHPAPVTEEPPSQEDEDAAS
jgi:broad specificity phosphatase PhoE